LVAKANSAAEIATAAKTGWRSAGFWAKVMAIISLLVLISSGFLDDLDAIGLLLE
jgi:hypothetical protein